MVFQYAFMALAKDREITGEIRRVLDYFFSQLDFENYLPVVQTDIAAALGLKTSNVSRSVRVLCDKQILLKGPKRGQIITYRLNPDYGLKGKAIPLDPTRAASGRETHPGRHDQKTHGAE